MEESQDKVLIVGLAIQALWHGTGPRTMLLERPGKNESDATLWRWLKKAAFGMALKPAVVGCVDIGQHNRGNYADAMI